MAISDERAIWLGRCVLPHEPSLRAWLSRRPLGGLEPDDVIQESYARLIGLPSVDHIRDVRSYFYQTAKSVVRDHLRRAQVVSIRTLPGPDQMEFADHDPSAETVVSDREELQRLADVIKAMKEPTRTIFILRRVEQLPQKQIAIRLGMPESTVEKHVMRALIIIAERFGRGGKRRSGASMGGVARRLGHGGGDGGGH